VKYRWKNKPVPADDEFVPVVLPVSSDLPFSAVFTVAINSSNAQGSRGREPFNFTPLQLAVQRPVPRRKQRETRMLCHQDW
jgi:hypothetical protein